MPVIISCTPLSDVFLKTGREDDGECYGMLNASDMHEAICITHLFSSTLQPEDSFLFESYLNNVTRTRWWLWGCRTLRIRRGIVGLLLFFVEWTGKFPTVHPKQPVIDAQIASCTKCKYESSTFCFIGCRKPWGYHAKGNRLRYQMVFFLLFE